MDLKRRFPDAIGSESPNTVPNSMQVYLDTYSKILWYLDGCFGEITCFMDSQVNSLQPDILCPSSPDTNCGFHWGNDILTEPGVRRSTVERFDFIEHGHVS